MITKICVLSMMVLFGLSACQNTPNTHSPRVLQQLKDIQAIPQTQHNQARLIRQTNHCLIEFRGQFETGNVTEYWIFQGQQLISNHTLTQSSDDDTAQQQAFDPQDPEKQASFIALKSQFNDQHLLHCQNFNSTIS